MKILIPIDGSESANRAVDQAISLSGELREAPEFFLLNVQWNIATGNVKLFINRQTINDYYQEQGMAALAAARTKLDAAGLAYSYHVSIGTPAEAVVQYARENKIEMIVMGVQGQNALSTLLLGSVVNKVLHLAECPVLLVK